VAFLIDGIVVGTPCAILFVVLLVSTATQVETDPVTGEISSGGGAVVGAYMFGYFVWIAVAIAYFGVMNGGERGQTVGKRVMKIQTRSDSTGGPIGVGRGLLRYFVVVLFSMFSCSVVALLDGLWPLWDPKRQTLHDKIAGSVVIDLV
jgi:uncharacterized RDD family membrane protein YckC